MQQKYAENQTLSVEPTNDQEEEQNSSPQPPLQNRFTESNNTTQDSSEESDIAEGPEEEYVLVGDVTRKYVEVESEVASTD